VFQLAEMAVPHAFIHRDPAPDRSSAVKAATASGMGIESNEHSEVRLK
jgi:hypothetical protein